MQEQRLLTARVLHHWGFGPRPGEYEAALTLGPTGTAANLLMSTKAENASQDAFTTPVPVFERVNKFTAADRAEAIRRRSQQQRLMTVWWLDRMITTQQPLLERMTWFWHGHWATSINKVQDPRLMLKQNETLRTTALGDFYTQSREMLRDPAMLIWLDGTGNRKGKPNENLGREFLELFSMGVGNYGEDDVREAARALTGWRLDLDSVQALFEPKWFDDTNKTVLSRTSNFDVDSLVDHVLSQPATAQFLVKRLWLRHMGEQAPTPQDQQEFVRMLGGSLAIQPLVTAMVYRTAMDPSPRSLALSPVPWLVSVMRSLGLTMADMKDDEQKRVVRQLYAMGQVPFVPPSVAGWPSGSTWFTSTSAQARLNLSLRLVNNASVRWLTRLSPARRPEALANHLGVPEWSRTTTAVLSAKQNSGRDAFVLAINSPDYLVGA